MKKVLTILCLVAFTGSVMAATSFTTKLNNTVNNISKKEQQLNNKIDKAQADRAAQKAAAKRQQEANKKAIEAQKAAIKKQQEADKKALEAQKAKIKQQREADKKAFAEKKAQTKTNINNTKKAVDNEKSFWKNLFK